MGEAVCLGYLHGKPVLLTLDNDIVTINGEEQPIKNIGKGDIEKFQKELAAVPDTDAAGAEAMQNAIRAAFLVKLIGNAVGDETINMLSHILDHVHYDVQKYLGEVEDDV